MLLTHVIVQSVLPKISNVVAMAARMDAELSQVRLNDAAAGCDGMAR